MLSKILSLNLYSGIQAKKKKVPTTYFCDSTSSSLAMPRHFSVRFSLIVISHKDCFSSLPHSVTYVLTPRRRPYLCLHQRHKDQVGITSPSNSSPLSTHTTILSAALLPPFCPFQRQYLKVLSQINPLDHTLLSFNNPCIKETEKGTIKYFELKKIKQNDQHLWSYTKVLVGGNVQH